MPQPTWSPLLDAEDAEAARQSVSSIADSISARLDDFRGLAPNSAERTALARSSLADGTAGLSLFFAYLALFTEREEDRLMAEQLADEAADQLAEIRAIPSLYCGFSGTAWLIRHLGGLWGDPDTATYTEEIDAALEQSLAQEDWDADLDLISGLAGVGAYLLEGTGGPAAARSLEQAVRHLDRLAQWTDQGATWFTPPRLLDLPAREACPKGYFNLGVAHGVPGIIVFLASAAKAGIARGRAKTLAHGAVNWLLAQKLGPESPSLFPSFLPPGETPKPSRLAWCYGDAGVAAALLTAADSLEEPTWRQAALEIARHAAGRPPETAQVNDGGLCHGAAGLAHMFNRMFQASGDERLRDAAVAWFQRLLRLRKKDVGVGGFQAWTALANTPGGFKLEDRIGFLTGAAGIGLSLIAAVSSQPPGWDRVMLLSTAPRDP